MIVPIFIHIHEKSDKELLEEMKRESEWRKMMEQEERRERERKEREARAKREMEEERRRREEEAYYAARNKNPWDYSFLPEGWSIFGTPLMIIKDL